MRRNSRYVKFGGAYFFFMGAPQTQRGLLPSVSLPDWTKTSHRQAGLVQCQSSPVFMIMVVVPSLTAGLVGMPRRRKGLAHSKRRWTIQSGK